MKLEELETGAVPQRWPILAISLLGAGFFVYFWFIALEPLGGSDVWFHLKTGQYILETQELPGPEDPYGISLDGRPLKGNALQGLRSQWLGQVAMFLLFKGLGLAGFAGFRALLVMLPFVAVYVLGGARGEPASAAAARLAVAGLPALITAAFLSVSYERPQAFSFVLAFVVVMMLERMRREGASLWWLVAMPAVMVLWSNLHGGYVIGVLLVFLWALGELASLLVHRHGASWAGFIAPPPANAKMFFAACVLGSLASSLHPGGFLQFNVVLNVAGSHIAQDAAGDVAGATVLSSVLEYKPMMYFYHTLLQKWPLFVLAFYGISLVSIAVSFWSSKRVSLPVLFASGFLVWFGTVYFRGVLFALPVLVLFVCWGQGGLRGRVRFAPALAMAATAVALVAYFGATRPAMLDPRPPATWISGNYPEGAVRFLREHEVRGPIFNNLAWGGYLIWSAWPDYRVFIDGRELDSRAFRDYVAILKGSPRWRETLDSYGINVILVPVISDMTGAVFPILAMIGWEEDDHWVPVYLRNNTVVLVRNVPENAGVIRCCAFSRKRLFGYVSNFAALMLISSPGHPGMLESMAAGFLWAGRTEEALRMLPMLRNGPFKRSLLERMAREVPPAKR